MHLRIKKVIKSAVIIVPQHKPFVPVTSKEKSYLRLFACCSINWSTDIIRIINLITLMAISEYKQEFEAPVAISLMCKRWFLSKRFAVPLIHIHIHIPI